MTAAAIPPVSLTLYERDFHGFAQALGASFERYGFAVVSDHDLDPAVVGEAETCARALFDLPEAVKAAYVLPGKGGARGYTPFGVETAKDADRVDLKAFWHVGRDLPADHRYAPYMPANLWPAEVPRFRPAVTALFEALDGLAVRLLRAVARYLGLHDRFFDEPVALGNSVLRLLHYPPVPDGAQGVRAGAHEDINVITLLLGAEEAGLEVLDRSGRWLPINPPAGSVVCNIGDMLSRLTNGVLPSTTPPGGQPPGRAPAGAALFDALFSSLPAGLRDRPPCPAA